MHRRFRSLIALSIAAVMIGGCSCAHLPPRRPVRIGINVWPGYAYAFIAKEKGYFKKNGVDVELILKDSQYESIELYKGGGCDGLFTVMPDVIILNSEGIATKAVCVTDYSTTGDAIIAGAGIGSPADLKGKTVGFEGINSSSHIFVLGSLERSGLGEADVRFKNLPGRSVLEELKKGTIDAGHAWNPVKMEAVKEGYGEIAFAKDVPYIIINVLAFDERTIGGRPDDVKAIVKSMFEARDYISADREDAVRIMSRSEGMSEEAMAGGLDGIVQPGLEENLRGIAESVRLISDFYITRGQLSRAFTAGDIVEPRFIEELVKEK